MENFIPIGTNASNHNDKDRTGYKLAESAFESSTVRLFDKLEAFSRFSSKRSLARFLCKSEIFKNILDINGSIVECGVFNGSGLFTWAQLSNIYEPTNYTRKIIGFDTFEGFPSTSSLDNSADSTPSVGDLHGDTLDSLKQSIEKYNNERHLSHIPNIELVQGDFMTTAEKYVEDNKHLLVSLLYLDFDLYEPTKKALEVFLPRMGKGSIVCFDEVNCPSYPGETLALLETLDLQRYKIKRFPTDPWISYIEL
ncbi:TylF/MycF/NovP-related O-methyltransferase [Cohnella abietis]|uniref:dTDP-6-deoxy-L-hexose 3-O-methyltransferase n=1 Tax=Cohnella abietis TaxID=2507935 RepID=A0A3T1DDF6_9BACL|nr:TylF/MycF/NovP-related O-methyltransferase [Cohnella abietis]BBI36127.1 hypothetical protein KCTCHS21_55260 [Cohnella abietis]